MAAALFKRHTRGVQPNAYGVGAGMGQTTVYNKLEASGNIGHTSLQGHRATATPWASSPWAR
jgi:hypothetical protein